MIDVTLTIHSPEGTRKQTLAGGRLTVGRGEAADLVINDSGLSRLHASIHQDGDRVWLLDEGSTNGSFVNGQPVAAAGTPLTDGSKITLGDYTTIWVNLARRAAERGSGGEGEKGRRGEGEKPQAARQLVPAIAAAVLLVVLGVGVYNAGFFDRGQNAVRAGGNNLNDSGGVTPIPPGPVTEPNNTNVAPLPDGNLNNNSAPPIPLPPTPDISGPAGPRKLYRQMSEEEQKEFIFRRAQHISRMMGNREYAFTDDVLPYIQRYVDAYAKRVGNGSAALWGEDLKFMFERARGVAPHIIRSFNARGVPPVVGLYIPMIESEYRLCLTSPVGAKGMFQFMPDTARGYGVDPEDRCDPQKMAPAAAAYINDRITEFGGDSMSVALGIAGYNRSPDSVRRDLNDVLNSQNKERSFWTLIANSDKLDRFFQNENVKYVPKFFGAAIVGETPWAFGLEMNPLSTYVGTQ